jgi:hypothetical protein
MWLASDRPTDDFPETAGPSIAIGGRAVPVFDKRSPFKI